MRLDRLPPSVSEEKQRLFEKIIRDFGKMGGAMKVIISVGYGAGWSSWNDGEVAKYMLTHQPIIEALDAGKIVEENDPLVVQMQEEILEKLGQDYVCVLGAGPDLRVVYAYPPFKVDEYDGFESISAPGDDSDWIMS